MVGAAKSTAEAVHIVKKDEAYHLFGITSKTGNPYDERYFVHAAGECLDAEFKELGTSINRGTLAWSPCNVERNNVADDVLRIHEWGIYHGRRSTFDTADGQTHVGENRQDDDVHKATPHVLRHTYATLAAPHIDVKTLQTVMGHSDIQTTMNLYTHPQERNIIQAVETLNNVFSA